MDALTYKETAFLMNISDDTAINIFIRYLRKDKIALMSSSDITYNNEARKQILKDLRESLKGERLEVAELSRHFGIDVSLLINSINDRFFKSQECLDYLEKYFNNKFRPQGKMGFYPASMIAPPEVTAFMNSENIEKLREWFKGRYTSGPAEHKIECMLKIR